MPPKPIISYKPPIATDDPISTFSEKDMEETIILDHPYRTDGFGIMLLLEGQIELKASLTSFSINAGSLYFIAPNMVYEIRKFSPGLKLIGIVVKSEYLNEKGIFLSSMDVLEVFAGAFLPFSVLTETELINLKHLMIFLHTKLQKRELDKFEKDAVSSAFLAIANESASIYRRNIEVAQVKLTRGEHITVDFLKLLGQHFKEQRSVQFYAKELYLSSRHLSQVIKEVTGKTAGELIDEAVILEAKVLLNNPRYNIAQITQLLHFSNQSFFSKFFKSKTGITPSTYRLQLS